jgi:putative hemolysin
VSIHWPFVVGAVFVVACLSASAMTLRAMTRVWMRHWVDAQLGAESGTGRAVTYLARSHYLLAVATASVAFVVALTGVLLGASVTAVTLTFLLGAVLVALSFLILGQTVPRAVARHWAPQLAGPILPVLSFAAAVLSPVMRLSGVAPTRRERPGAPRPDERAEFEGLLREGELEGIGKSRELEFISEVVEFGETLVSEVMTQRTAVTAVDRELPALEMARIVADSGFSRVPVYRGSPDEIIGIVHVFDLLATAGEEWPKLRPVVQVPMGKRCSQLLRQMLTQRQHLAVVLDEHGGTVGIVTLEDLLEELVGDIKDEHDVASSSESAGAGPAAVEGTTAVLDVATRFGVPLTAGPNERTETIGGLLARRLGRIPAVGERVRLAGLDITVVDAEPARVVRLLVQRAGSGSPIDLDGAAK